jgi:hypothetical protein
MDQIRKTEDEQTDAVRQLWEVYAEILKKRGHDIDQLLRDWTQNQKAKLASSGAQADFDELSASGCVPQVLVVLLALLRWSPTMESFWQQLYGNRERRRAVTKSLEKTALAFEQLFTFVIALEDEKVVSKFNELGRIAPSRLVSELRLYARMLDFMNRVPSETDTRSLKEFAKFVLTDYVKDATGRFRDRNVSALMAGVVGPPDYNEVAQRMWRHRNLARMKNHYSRLSDLLLSIGRVLTSRT